VGRHCPVSFFVYLQFICYLYSFVDEASMPVKCIIYKCSLNNRPNNNNNNNLDLVLLADSAIL